MGDMTKIDTKKVGQNLVRLRGTKTQTEVAKEVNISVSALSMYERGERIPRDTIKIRLSAYYNEPIASIFFEQ